MSACHLLEQLVEEPHEQALLGHRLWLSHNSRSLASACLAVAEEASIEAFHGSGQHRLPHNGVALLLGSDLIGIMYS